MQAVHTKMPLTKLQKQIFNLTSASRYSPLLVTNGIQELDTEVIASPRQKQSKKYQDSLKKTLRNHKK